MLQRCGKVLKFTMFSPTYFDTKVSSSKLDQTCVNTTKAVARRSLGLLLKSFV